MSDRLRTSGKWLAIVCFWLLVWQAASMVLDNEILLAGPIDVMVVLVAKLPTTAFWASVSVSFLRIVVGFVSAFVLGLFLGGLSARFRLFANILQPLVLCIKSIPVVCIIVLLLIWMGSQRVSALAVFLVVFPAIYASAQEACGAIDGRMREMLTVFRVSFVRRALFCYWPSMLPFILASCKVAVGMSWKAGVAAEIIGIPTGTIGEQLYLSKIALATADLFAWTLVIVLVSLLCEKTFLALLRASGRWGRKLALAWPSALVQSSQHDCNVSSHTQEGQGIGEDTALVATHLRKSFGDNLVLDDVSFKFAFGECWQVAGPSGEGKTTLLRIIAGLEKPDAGTLTGQAKTSMVFQEARLFEDVNAVDNILLVTGKALAADEVANQLTTLLPRESLNQPVRELSGGMRRRVELMRALLTSSQFVILDEPFTGLDAQNQERVVRCLERLLGERTLIIATHDYDDIVIRDIKVLTL